MGSEQLETIFVDESGDHHQMIEVHELGFVKLIDTMGDDEEVENAARISYGKGTRKVSQTRNLIRYLMRHKHTSPFEMCEVKFHIKLPIFIMRQLVRHRTANINEYSGRYSVMSDEFYLPQGDYLAKQSTTNTQHSGNQKHHQRPPRLANVPCAQGNNTRPVNRRRAVAGPGQGRGSRQELW